MAVGLRTAQDHPPRRFQRVEERIVGAIVAAIDHFRHRRLFLRNVVKGIDDSIVDRGITEKVVFLLDPLIEFRVGEEERRPALHPVYLLHLDHRKEERTGATADPTAYRRRELGVDLHPRETGGNLAGAGRGAAANHHLRVAISD